VLDVLPGGAKLAADIDAIVGTSLGFPSRLTRWYANLAKSFGEEADSSA
jgi:hypothetical protein